MPCARALTSQARGQLDGPLGWNGRRQALVVSYWKVIMSVRLSVVAFDFKGSLAKFALPEFNTL
jgi:hypothetical protein